MQQPLITKYPNGKIGKKLVSTGNYIGFALPIKRGILNVRSYLSFCYIAWPYNIFSIRTLSSKPSVMRLLLIIILLVFITSACQKKTDNVAQVSHTNGTPAQEIDSSNYYSIPGDTAFYAGITCDSLYTVLTYFTDTVLVFRLSNDSIRIREKYSRLYLYSYELFNIDSSNCYRNSGRYGYTTYAFSGFDSLSFRSRYYNPCSTFLTDEYNYAFKGKRYK